MIIFIYIFLGIIAALACAIIATLIVSYLWALKNPDEVLKSMKLRDELQSRKENSLVCEACITYRKHGEIAILQSSVTDPPRQFRYCVGNPKCQEIAVIKLREYILEWQKAMKHEAVV